MRAKLFIFICTVVLGTEMFLFSEALASGRVNALNDKNIEEFIVETTNIASDQNRSLKEKKRYLERHLDDKARFKSVIKYVIPGFPSQETAVSMKKDDFIDNIEKGSETIDSYSTEIKIRDIKISSDKEKATVQTQSIESGTMPIPDGGEVREIPIEGVSECLQILMLEKGIIKMYSANCKTTITFSSF